MGTSRRPPVRRAPSQRSAGEHLRAGRGTAERHALRSGTGLSAECGWSTFTTRSPRDARDFVTGTYRGQDVRIGGDPDTFEFTVHSRRLHLFGIDVIDHVGSLAMVGGPGDHVLISEVLRGTLVVTTPGGYLSMVAGDAVMTSVNEPRQVSWHDLNAVVVRLDALEFRQLAAELAGVDPAARRVQVEKGSRSRVRQWSAAVRYVVSGVLQNPDAARSALAQRESFRLLAATALEVFPQPDFSLAGDAVPPPLPATLRRAIEFIEANAGAEITVADIARSAGLSPRGLQAAFHRHLDSSPAAYLRRVRLEHAHHELEQADARSGRSVAEIAARWGFLHPGRFAAWYRERYGVPPSHTLNH